MKQHDEKQLDEDMHFFRRDLYAQFGSLDSAKADAADEMWEEALQAYRLHLRGLSRYLPGAAKKLSRMCFHDAELMNPRCPVMLSLPEVGLIAVAKRTALDEWQPYLIWYLLDGEVEELPPPRDWPHSPDHAYWLYDEFDVREQNPNQLIHRILLSDGRIMVVPFVKVGLQKMPKDAASLAKQVMQPA